MPANWYKEQPKNRNFLTPTGFKLKLEKFEDFLYIEFKEFQSAITPGQFVAIYQKNQLIASGVIL